MNTRPVVIIPKSKDETVRLRSNIDFRRDSASDPDLLIEMMNRIAHSKPIGADNE